MQVRFLFYIEHPVYLYESDLKSRLLLPVLEIFDCICTYMGRIKRSVFLVKFWVVYVVWSRQNSVFIYSFFDKKQFLRRLLLGVPSAKTMFNKDVITMFLKHLRVIRRRVTLWPRLNKRRHKLNRRRVSALEHQIAYTSCAKAKENIISLYRPM